MTSEIARQIAAQCWCDEETSHIEMDTAICEAVAKRLDTWMDTAAQAQRNCDFYRGLVDQCAQHLGAEAFTADDGTLMKDPVLLKVPELVAAAVRAA